MAENTQHLELARRLAAEFSRFDEVKAIALGGSVASGAAGPGSDIDLYVFTTAPVPLQKRKELADKSGYTRADLGLEFWDPGDEWMDAASGIEVDVIYWDTAWIEDQLHACFCAIKPVWATPLVFGTPCKKRFHFAIPQAGLLPCNKAHTSPTRRSCASISSTPTMPCCGG